MTALAESPAVPQRSEGTYREPASPGAGPVAAGGPVRDGDRTGAARDRSRTARSWPLVLLAFPAAAEVWSGWVGIAQKTGFGLVSPLPGIWSSLHLDTTITLPIGVEAYAAYALRAWLATDPWITTRTRRFAKWSAICSFALGMAGQVAYHLLVQAGQARAPWGITTVVSCLPVLVLGMGTALAHMLRGDAAQPRNSGTGEAGEPTTRRTPAWSSEDRAGPGPDQATTTHPRTGSGPAARTRAAPHQDHGTTAGTARPGPQAGQQETDQRAAVARRLAAEGKAVSRRALRSNGIKGSNAALNALARTLNAELAAAEPDARPDDRVTCDPAAASAGAWQ
jgi:hypothetical protein